MTTFEWMLRAVVFLTVSDPDGTLAGKRRILNLKPET